jgi:hypothetical protein
MVADELRLLAFYEGTGTDHAGRTFDAIIASNFETLEAEHDFIQWLFPLPERSPVNPEAPTLTQADIDAFRSDPALRARLRRALDRMLSFYGLAMVERDGAIEVSLTSAFADRRKVWLNRHNHNHLRLTRILRCCVLLSLRAEAEALGRCLGQLAEAHPRDVSEETRGFWTRASSGRP